MSKKDLDIIKEINLKLDAKDKARAKAGKEKLRTIEVRRGNAYGIIMVPADQFKFVVRGPLSLVKHNGLTVKHTWQTLEEEFFHQLTQCYTYGHLAKSKVAKPKELKELKANLELVSRQIFQMNLDIELEQLDTTIEDGLNVVDGLIKKRVKVAPSKYPANIVMTTKHMIKWWNKITGNRKKITYYTPGLKYQQEEYKGTKPDKINPKENPAGAFIQGVLTTYFRCPVTQMQLKRLLALAYESES